MPMTSSPDRRYCDSAACLAHLMDEEGRADACQLVLDAAEEGKLEIVVSALTLVEVVKLRGRPPIPSSVAETVRQFFRNRYFLVVDVDRFIAEHARHLFWEHGIKAKDAVHVATPLSVGVPYLDTFDEELIAKSGKVGGDPPLTICRPGDGMQGVLAL